MLRLFLIQIIWNIKFALYNTDNKENKELSVFAKQRRSIDPKIIVNNNLRRFVRV